MSHQVSWLFRLDCTNEMVRQNKQNMACQSLAPTNQSLKTQWASLCCFSSGKTISWVGDFLEACTWMLVCHILSFTFPSKWNNALCTLDIGLVEGAAKHPTAQRLVLVFLSALAFAYSTCTYSFNCDHSIATAHCPTWWNREPLCQLNNPMCICTDRMIKEC